MCSASLASKQLLEGARQCVITALLTYVRLSGKTVRIAADDVATDVTNIVAADADAAAAAAVEDEAAAHSL
jgi:hypothetical protein